MNVKPKVSPEPKPVNSFEKFAKCFYLYGQFRGMEATVWQALEETLNISQNEYTLETWLNTTGYYGNNDD